MIFVDSGAGQLIVKPENTSTMSRELWTDAVTVDTDSLTRFMSCDSGAMLSDIRAGQNIVVNYHTSQTGSPVADDISLIKEC